MKQFTEGQRYELNAYLQSGKSKDEIARLLGFHRSTIYREICRNKTKPDNSYYPWHAQQIYEWRKKERKRSVKFTDEIRKRAFFWLRNYQFSPEQIAGSCKENDIPMVSHERLYQWIWEDKKKGGLLYMDLRRTGRKYRKRKNMMQNRGWIKDRVNISQRPDIVDNKERFGDLEIDTIIGKNHSGAILTINDRATGKLWTKKLPNKEAKYVTAATIEMLMPYKEVIHTITSDNGTEFAGHKNIAKELDIKFYFARPYHAWERGANENLNGLIRQYIPKTKEFNEVSENYLRDITFLINVRPRKRYAFLNPIQLVNNKLNEYNEILNQMVYEMSHL
jgi:IS30 family transposase